MSPGKRVMGEPGWLRRLNDSGSIACSNADVLCPRLETPKEEDYLAIRLAMAKGGKTDS